MLQGGSLWSCSPLSPPPPRRPTSPASGRSASRGGAELRAQGDQLTKHKQQTQRGVMQARLHEPQNINYLMRAFHTKPKDPSPTFSHSLRSFSQTGSKFPTPAEASSSLIPPDSGSLFICPFYCILRRPAPPRYHENSSPFTRPSRPLLRCSGDCAALPSCPSRGAFWVGANGDANHHPVFLTGIKTWRNSSTL